VLLWLCAAENNHSIDLVKGYAIRSIEERNAWHHCGLFFGFYPVPILSSLIGATSRTVCIRRINRASRTDMQALLDQVIPTYMEDLKRVTLICISNGSNYNSLASAMIETATNTPDSCIKSIVTSNNSIHLEKIKALVC
jgi:hypothetical protein